MGMRKPGWRQTITTGRSVIRRLSRRVAEAPMYGFQFTWAGGFFSVMMVLIGVAAINTEANLLLLVFGAGMGTVVISGAITRRNVRNLEVTRTAPATATAGQSFVIRYRVTNRHRWTRVFSLNLMDVDLPAASAAVDAGPAPEAYVHVVQPARTVTTETSVCVARRGRLTLDTVRVTTRYPLSLFTGYYSWHISCEVLVYPALGRLRRDVWPSVASSDPGEGGSFQAGRGTSEFYGLRDYRHGDSPRWIHWRRSARTGQLVVREMTDAQPDRALVVLDTHLHRDDDDSLREQAVRLAATLCDEALRRGRLTGLIATGDPWVVVPPATGHRQAARLMRELALLTPDPPDRVDALAHVHWQAAWRETPCVLVAAVEDDRTRGMADHLIRRGAQVTILVAGTTEFDNVFDGAYARAIGT